MNTRSKANETQATGTQAAGIQATGTQAPRTQGPGTKPAGAKAAGTKATGLKAVTAQDFSFSQAVGGIRGLVESMAPGVLFVVAFVVFMNHDYALWLASGVSLAAALVAVVVRLIQRSSLSQAFSGVGGIVVGVAWALLTGRETDFFAWGLWVNAIYSVAVVITIAARTPAVGLVVECLRVGFAPSQPEAAGQPVAADQAEAAAQPELAATSAPAQATTPDQLAASTQPQANATNAWAGVMAWRKDPALVRRYAQASWIWVALFGLRLLVQVPLFYADQFVALGTARLIMGVPLWALVLYLTWLLVRGAIRRPTAQEQG